jgi:AraC-like DNA-binding protein
MLDHGGWGLADLTVLAPMPSLSDVIEFIWIDTWSSNRRPPRRFRIVADDAPHIIWHAHRGRRRSQTLGIVGARSTFHDLDVSTRLITVGVRLRPGVLPALAGRSARELTDRSIRIDPRLAHGTAASPERVIEALTHYVGEHTAAQRTHRFVQRARSADPRGSHSIRGMARELDINERSLRNLSRDHLGMSLKRFMKIRRLHAALRLAHSTAALSWSRIASEAGYADQAHLIRDCRALLGETPAAFLDLAAG